MHEGVCKLQGDLLNSLVALSEEFQCFYTMYSCFHFEGGGRPEDTPEQK